MIGAFRFEDFFGWAEKSNQDVELIDVAVDSLVFILNGFMLFKVGDLFLPFLDNKQREEKSSLWSDMTFGRLINCS